MRINHSLGTTFGKVSSLYDKSRVTYPKELIDDIITYSKIKPNAMILDVGCGSGQATLPFAERGYNTVGLDISKELITIAKKKCSQFKNTKFELSSFEKAKFNKNSFGLITSGLAWHWVKPDGRYEKAHQILKDNGALAFFWSYQQKGKSEIVKEVGKVLDKYGLKGAGPVGSRMKDYAYFTYNELQENPLFSNIEKRKYSIPTPFSREKYIGLVLTYSWVLKLPQNEQKQLKEDLTRVLHRYQEPFIIPYKYVLILAKKRNQRSTKLKKILKSDYPQP